MNNNGNKTFIKITNKNIYDKIEALEATVSSYCKSNEIVITKMNGENNTTHAKIFGRINLLQWLILAALATASTAIVWLYEMASI